MTLPMLLVAALHGFVAPGWHGGVSSSRSATARMGLFDGFFSDPGKSTSVPSGFASASHILLTGEDAPDMAAKLQERIAAGELSFADAAAQYSACPSKGKGGDLGIFSSLGSLAFLPYEGRDVAVFDELVFSSSTPLATVVSVDTSFGTHLVLVDARG